MREELEQEAGGVGSLLDSLLESILNSNPPGLFNLVRRAEFVLADIRKNKSPECYKYYKDKYYEVLGHKAYE